MKRTFITIALAVLLLAACGESLPPAETSSSSYQMSVDKGLVKAACGQCQFDLEGEGCQLAIRFAQFTWFVDGTDIDNLDGAHDVDGFCDKVHDAVVSGHVEDGRFIAESFELVDDA